MKANSNVVLGATFEYDAFGAPTVYRAYDPFFDAAAGWGIVQTAPDQDFVVRKHLHVPDDPNADDKSSLSWEAARLVGVPVAQDPQNRFAERWINYYARPGKIPNISFHRALKANPVVVSNKVVFIGSSLKSRFSGQRRDEFPSPYGKRSEFLAGVDVQATQFLNLLRGDWLTRVPAHTERSVIVVAGIILGLGLIRLRPLTAISVALVTAFGVAAFAYFIFAHHRIWFAWLIIVAVQMPVALIWSVGFNSLQLYVQNRLLEQTLALHVSPKRAKQLRSKEFLKPGAEKQMLTILFTDIEGFTSFSEGMDSDELARFMNRYFEIAVTQGVHKTDGFVVKYIGDAIFAFWNAPEQQSDHAALACEAALLLHAQETTYTKGQTASRLRTRLGLHTGVANVGNFGSATRIDYTAIGENINLAARMEGLNKYLGTDVLITRDTKEGLDSRFVTRLVGRFQLKGFEKAVEVYELVGRSEEAEASRPWRETFAEGVKAFQAKNFDGAESAFRRTLDLKPNDGPSIFCLSKIVELRSDGHELPADWAGEIELKEK
jgi:adenylate cyclase